MKKTAGLNEAVGCSFMFVEQYIVNIILWKFVCDIKPSFHIPVAVIILFFINFEDLFQMSLLYFPLVLLLMGNSSQNFL